MGNLCCCFGFRTNHEDSDNSDDALFRQRLANSTSATSSTNEAVETGQSDTIQSPPGPLPCNAYSNSQPSRVITGQQVAVDSCRSKLQLSSAAISNGCNLDSSMNPSSGKLNKKAAQNFDSSETEDVCPICLEEYSTDNPKITLLQCSHVYHLSCILEWQQRKNNCPICDQMMEYDEIYGGM